MNISSGQNTLFNRTLPVGEMLTCKNIFKLFFVLILLTIYIWIFGRVSLRDHMMKGTIISYYEEDLQSNMQPGQI